jgi:hypothetical protein
MSCYLTRTTTETHKLIQDNLAETPVYGGWVDARGPRCVCGPALFHTATVSVCPLASLCTNPTLAHATSEACIPAAASWGICRVMLVLEAQIYVLPGDGAQLSTTW